MPRQMLHYGLNTASTRADGYYSAILRFRVKIASFMVGQDMLMSFMYNLVSVGMGHGINNDNKVCCRVITSERIR